MSDAARIAVLQARITQIDGVLADFAMGKQVVELSYDGETVKYTPTNIETLERQLARDKMELARCEGRPTGYGRRRMRY